MNSNSIANLHVQGPVIMQRLSWTVCDCVPGLEGKSQHQEIGVNIKTSGVQPTMRLRETVQLFSA